MSQRIAIKCDGPTCDTVITEPEVIVRNELDPDRRRVVLPDSWYTVHSNPERDSHYCSMACLARDAAKRAGLTIVTLTPREPKQMLCEAGIVTISGD